MAYPSMRNPRELRSHLHTIYGEYARGEAMFPRKRLRLPTEALPRKTQEIAGRLPLAWAQIDNDRAYFSDAALAMGRTMQHEFDAAGGGEARKGLVVAMQGRNAVEVGVLTVGAAARPTLEISTWPRRLFLETYQGHEFDMGNGQSITLRDGEMVGDPDLFVVRQSNASGLFGMSPESAERFLQELAG